MKTSIASHGQSRSLRRFIDQRLHRILVLPVEAAVVAAIMTAGPGMAADFYWTGQSPSSDNIDQNDNWWGTAHPASGDNLYFDNRVVARHSPYNNYGPGGSFGSIITFSGAGGIKWCGDTTWASKFENNSDAYLFEIAANIGNRNGRDIEINPVGSGGIKVDGSVTLTDGKQLNVNGAKTLTFAGAISGASATMAILQGATVVLQSAANYTGDTYVNNGTLRLSANNALANSGNYLRMGETWLSSAVANVNLDGGLSLSTPINIRAVSTGVKTIANTAGTSGVATFSGDVSLDGDGRAYANSGGLALTGSILDLKNQTLTIDGPGNTIISGILQNSTGAGKLTKLGSGVLTLSGANTYSGDTRVSDGTIRLQANNALSTGPNVIIGSAGKSATLDLGGFNQDIAQLSTGGAPTSQTIVNNSALADSVLTFSGPGSSAFGGIIKDSITGGARKVSLVVSGGTLTLTAMNTYTGGTWISGGTAIVQGGDDRLPVGTTVTLGSGSNSGILQLGDDQTIAGLAISGTGPGNAVVGGRTSTSKLTINNTAEVMYSGKLGGTEANQNILALVKTGPGVLILTELNTYSGMTSIGAGKLVGQTGGSCANSAFTVSSGAANGVKVASPGGLWSCGSLTYNSGTTYAEFDFSGFAPSLAVAPLSTGALTANGSVRVVLRNLSSPAAAGNHPLIHYSGIDLSLGSFTLFSSLPLNVAGGLVVDTANKNVSLQVNLVAPNLVYTVPRGVSKRITLSDIQAYGGLSSGRGSPAYAITGVSATSAQGGTVISDSSNILYTYPATGSPATDSFSYTITDGTLTVTATVTLTFQAQVGPGSGSITVSGGIASVTLYGIPSLRYDVQRSTDGMSTWTTLTTVPPLDAYPIHAASDGSICFTDNFSDMAVKPSSAFYRTVQH